ncbi:MAG: hypothetical protein LBV44_02670 [Methylobacillus sp.]|jgi:hypothetical protein|nr:hypothetical protein [Methylobacillus sp.]
MMQARSVSAGSGWHWLSGGARLFMKNPPVWMAMVFLYFAITMPMIFGLEYALKSTMPGVGGFIVGVLGVMLVGGQILGCRALDKGEPLKVAHLFAAFPSGRLGQLAIVGVIFGLGYFLIMKVSGMANAQVLLEQQQSPELDPALAQAILQAYLLMLLMLIPLMMLYVYAPALVMLGNMSALNAMAWSFVTCLRNILPWLVYCVIVFIICFVLAFAGGVLFALLAAILGQQLITVLFLAALALVMLVVVPIALTSTYRSYTDVFNDGNMG